MHSIARRMRYAPHLPLPYVLSHSEEEYKEGSIICTRTKELKLRGGAVIELTIPGASHELWAPWDTPTSWMQVKPVNHPEEQRRLQQIHEKEVTEAEATAVTGGYGAHLDEDGEEEWDEQAVFWHDDETWGWALIPPDVAEGSPWRWQEPESEAQSTPDSDRPDYSDSLAYITATPPRTAR